MNGGQYTDAETGFVYLRARYYDPATGQFLTRDPLEAETREPYGYGYNDPINMIDPSGLCSVGPVRVGFLSNDDGSCRGAGVVSNALVQTAFVAGTCTFTGGLGCFAANGIVVAINASNRYDACEGFSTDFLVHTGIDVAAAAVNMRSLRSASGTLSMVDDMGGAILRTTVTDGVGLPASMVVRNYLAPNALRASGATGLAYFSHWFWDQR